MPDRKTILTGDRPTGPLHLGHYVGSLKSRVELQGEYQTFVEIADVQALTDNFVRPERISENTIEVMFDYLAVGLDPDKATFVLQSMVPEIHELAVYYLNVVTLARAMRNPTVKAEIQEKHGSPEEGEMFGHGRDIPLGFLTYPIHQAADITAFDADLVPVGDDQLPMIEQTREIVRKINSYYGEGLLKEPEALLGDFARLPGTDGRPKMSKSLDNCIYLRDTNSEVERKVHGMYTDPKRIHADVPGTVQGNPVFTYLDAFDPNLEEVEELKRRYRKGRVGDVELKRRLAGAINSFLDPVRQQRAYWEARVPQVQQMLLDHTQQARTVSKGVLDRVQTGMRLRPLYA